MAMAASLFDLTADWNRVMGSPFDVSVFVKNIADKQYSTSGLTQLPSIGPNVHAGLGFQGEMAGAPRTVGLSAEAQQDIVSKVDELRRREHLDD